MTGARRVPTWALTSLGAIIGVVIGLVAAALAIDGGDGSNEPTVTLAPVESGVPADQQDNARAFIAAWQRYRQGTFVAELTFERRLSNGQVLSTTRLMVQQPPRRVVRQMGSVSSIGDAGQVSCDKVEDQTVCTPPSSQSYDAIVSEELVAWATAFAGDAPVYLVERPEPGCFELRLARPLPAPPYGNVSRFCFDEATGALRARQVVRDTATDTEEATRISATVTEADWAAAGG